jgi:hypothetical protein
MPTRNVNLTEHFDQFVEKVALLRSLAAEAFQQLDQGGGIEIEDTKELARFVSSLGRLSAKQAKRRAGTSPSRRIWRRANMSTAHHQEELTSARRRA